MANPVLLLKPWGNNLGVRLPASIAKEAKLKADQAVRLRVEEGCVVIEPVRAPELTLEERLARYDVTQHGGEAMPTAPIGAERW